MIKNKIILGLAIGLLFTPLLHAKAENVTTTATTTSATTQPVSAAKNSSIEKAKVAELKAKLMKETDALRKDLEAKKAEMQKKIAEKKDVVKKRLEVKSQEKVRTALNKIYDKLNTQLNKIETVDAKILTKITAFEKEGKNVTAVKAQYSIAKQAFDKAKAEILATRMIASEEITKETSKEAIRETVKNAEDTVRGIGAEYRKILPLLAKVEGDNSIKN